MSEVPVEASHFLASEQLVGMSRAEQRKMVTQVEQDWPITPDNFDRFLRPARKWRPTDISREGLIALGLWSAYGASSTAYHFNNGDLIDIVELPKIVRAGIETVYNTTPWGDIESAAPTLGDQLPNFTFWTATGYVAFEGLRKLILGHGMSVRIKDAQDSLTRKNELGEITWSIEPGSTIAFVGKGDPLATRIVQKNPGEIVQIAHEKVDGPWVKLPDTADRDDIMLALQRANAEEAGEILVLPTTSRHEFLPDDKDYDFSISTIVYYIKAADAYCKEQNIAPKPVIVVGNKQQKVDIQTRGLREEDDSKSELNLKDRLESLAAERGAPVTVFDPTEIIMRRIAELSQDRPVVLTGTAESMTKYGGAFLDELRKSIAVDNRKQPILVHYGLKDITTSNEMRQGDIAVVLSRAERKYLVEKLGMPETHVLEVARETLDVIAPHLNHDLG